MTHARPERFDAKRPSETNDASPFEPPRWRFRVLLVALLGVVPLTLFVQWSDLKVGGTMVAGPFPPLAACMLWAMLLLVNAAWKKIRGGEPIFASSESLIVLAVWLAANTVAGRGMLHPLLTSLAGPTYYARTVAPSTRDAIFQHLSTNWAVTDPAAVTRFFEGYGVPVPWAVWLRPLLVWSLFLLPFLAANVCLCALFERSWARDERLAYPLIALPLEAFDDRHPLFRKNARAAMLLGLTFPVLLHGFGALHAYVPNVPCIPFFNDLSDVLVNPPWSAAKPLYLNLYPLLIGATFLAPSDISFSVWFFLILNKIELIVTASAGWADGAAGASRPVPPYLEQQSAGAFLVLAASLALSARRSIRGSLDSETERRDSLRFALGFALGIAGMLAWFAWTGMPLWFGALFFGFYFAVALVLSRLMSQAGLPWLLAPILPDRLILSITGSSALASSSLVGLMPHVQHLRDTRQMLAPAVFQTGKIRDAAGFPMFRFYLLIFAAILIALGVGIASALPIFYRYGALMLMPRSDGLQMCASVIPLTATGQAAERLSGSFQAAPESILPILGGGAVTWGLYLLRLRFLWWPLHPLGYALTGTLQVGYANKMLFSIFLGWSLKSISQRLGGPRGFHLLKGAAMGLILGDLLMGGVLKLLDALFGPSGYAIF
jgi:hypothetical protein